MSGRASQVCLRALGNMAPRTAPPDVGVGMVWYGMVWYGMVWYGMVWYGMVWYGMLLLLLLLLLRHPARAGGRNCQTRSP